jgi:uncharacterized protein involved in outer membrane biogenesis
MKKLLRIVVILLLVVVVAVGGLYFYRNTLIKRAVESQASSSLGVPTTLGGANLGLFGGTLSLADLKIGSPDGYKAPQMFTLGELGLGVKYGELRQKPIRVSKITVDKPMVVVEEVGGKFNFQALMDKMGPSTPKTDDKPTEPVKLIIDELNLNNASVVVKSSFLPQEITVNIPSVTLKDIGNADGAKNGAAIKDVVGAMMSGLAAEAAKRPELGKVSEMMKQQAAAVAEKVSKELGKQVNQITGKLTDDINKTLGGTGIDVNKVTGGKDAGKAVEDGLKGLIPGKKDDKEKQK